MAKNKRSSLWTFICYPDSAPENWQFILSDTHVPVAISPLHDADLTSDGDEKKPHWHVMLKFDSLKSYEQVLEISKMCNATIPIIVASAKGLIRYFCHLDNPNKAQYKIEDIKCLNGFDISPYLAPTVRERHTIMADIIDFIDSHEIYEVKDFVNYARMIHFDDWFPVVCGSGFRLIECYIRSNRNMAYRDRKHTPKYETRDDSISFD